MIRGYVRLCQEGVIRVLTRYIMREWCDDKVCYEGNEEVCVC